MKAILVDVENGIKEIDFKDNLQFFYEQIGCDCIDIIKRSIGGREYRIVIDDAGLLKGSRISAFDKNNIPALAGNLIICKDRIDGNLIGLNDDEIGEIRKHTGLSVDYYGTVSEVIITDY